MITGGFGVGGGWDVTAKGAVIAEVSPLRGSHQRVAVARLVQGQAGERGHAVDRRHGERTAEDGAAAPGVVRQRQGDGPVERWDRPLPVLVSAVTVRPNPAPAATVAGGWAVTTSWVAWPWRTPR